MANSQFKIKYGKNLKGSNVAVESGSVYFDTEKNRVYYDNPDNAIEHTLIGPSNIAVVEPTSAESLNKVEVQTLNGFSANEFLKKTDIPNATIETSPVAIDSEGKLVSSSEISIDSTSNFINDVELETLNGISANGFVQVGKIGQASPDETQPVHITDTGKLVTKSNIPEISADKIKLSDGTTIESRIENNTSIIQHNIKVKTQDFISFETTDPEEQKLKNLGYNLRCDLKISDAIDNMIPYVTFSLADLEESGAIIANQFKCHTGGIYIYAKDVGTLLEITLLTIELRKAAI